MSPAGRRILIVSSAAFLSVITYLALKPRTHWEVTIQNTYTGMVYGHVVEPQDCEREARDLTKPPEWRAACIEVQR